MAVILGFLPGRDKRPGSSVHIAYVHNEGLILRCNANNNNNHPMDGRRLKSADGGGYPMPHGLSHSPGLRITQDYCPDCRKEPAQKATKKLKIKK